MLSRINSIRTKVITVAFIVAVLGLLTSYFVAGAIEHSVAKNEAVRNLSVLARAAIEISKSSSGADELAMMIKANPSVGFLVEKNGQKYFDGSLPPKMEDTVYVTVHEGGYTVTTSTVLVSVSSVSAEITLVSGVLALAILLTGFLASSLFSRSLAGPIADAIGAAEMIADGDLSARMSMDGPDELFRLAKSFNMMAQRLEESDAAQRRFLSDLAHEIATPLNAISGFALALGDGTISSPEESKEASWIIHNETTRLQQLLQDLRNLDVLDLTYTSHREVLRLNTFLNQMAMRFAPETRTKSITVDVSAGKIEMFVDQRLLEMVMQNFFTNAIRYVNEGGRIKLYAQETGHAMVRLGVQDNGMGISVEHLNHIFDRLYRVDEARNRASGGSGLGLAIAKRAALSLGGHIEVGSEYGKGSDFALIIPKSQPGMTGRMLLSLLRRNEEGEPSQA